MKTYQTLSLVGCIIGIILMLGLWGLLGIGSVANDISLNMSKSFSNSSELAVRQQQHESANHVFMSGIAGISGAFFMLIALIPITFIIRKPKVVGIILIIFGIIITGITNLWGIIPLALLLPAGIVALREKKQINNVGVKAA